MRLEPLRANQAEAFVLKMIQTLWEYRELHIDFLRIQKNDRKTFELLQMGISFRIYGLESEAAESLGKRFKPEHFKDLVLMLQLLQPASILSGKTDIVIETRSGRFPLSDHKIKLSHAFFKQAKIIFKMAWLKAHFLTEFFAVAILTGKGCRELEDKIRLEAKMLRIDFGSIKKLSDELLKRKFEDSSFDMWFSLKGLPEKCL